MRTPADAERSFEACLNSYLDDLRVRRYSRSYRALAAFALGRLSEHLVSPCREDVRAVDEEHLARYAAHLASLTSRWGGRLKASSRTAELVHARRFFAWLTRRGHILRDPAAELSLPRLRPLPRAALNLTQARRLMSAPDRSTALGRRDRAILELLYGTGIRLSECSRLDLGDLDLSEGLVLVRDGKGRKDRYVPVAGRATVAVGGYLRRSRLELARDTESALFLSRGGRRLSTVRLARVVKAHGGAVGVAISTHSLRHACATHLIRGGADIRHVQALLGHRQLESTAIYTRVEVADLREVLRRCHPRERAARARGGKIRPT